MKNFVKFHKNFGMFCVGRQHNLTKSYGNNGESFEANIIDGLGKCRIFYSRVGKFMHWCFFPDECDGRDLFFTNGCLKEISKFITTLYNKKKGEG